MTSAATGLLMDLQEQAAGVDPAAARLSWIVPLIGDGMQTRYRVQVADAPDGFDAPVRDTGEVDSPASTGVLLADLGLPPSTPGWWRVRASTDAPGTWSAPARFTTAPERWDAAPIWAAGDPQPSWALLRTEIDLPDVPVRAAHAELVALSPEGGPGGANGPRGGRQHVAKMWANGQVVGYASARSQDERPMLHTLDLTAVLRPGANALAVHAWAQEGRQVAVRTVVVLEDGTRIEHASSPATWRGRDGGALLPEAGSIADWWYRAPVEDWDLREEPDGWTLPGFDDSAWDAAAPAPALPGPPRAATVSLERICGEPAALAPIGPGTWALDLGREIVGGLQVAVHGRDGTRLAVRLGEQRGRDGRVISRLPTGNLYEETWTLREGPQVAEHWGYRAFRYAELELAGSASDLGVDPDLDLEVRPVVLRSAPRHTGAFTSSDPDLDRVHGLCRYSIEATSMELYIDTPARERLPYEGDAYVNQLSQYACERGYALARASNRFLTRRPTWPSEYHLMPVLLAWEEYLATGDDAQLRGDLELWRRAGYDRHLGADGLLHKDPGPSSAWDADLVDWPDTCRDGYEFTEVNTVLNAFQAAAHEALARICGVLDRPAEAAHHAAAAARMREAIAAYLLREDGVLRDGLGTDHASQHASAIPTALGVAPIGRKEVREAIGAHLAAGGMRMSVYGAQFLLDALFLTGRADEGIALMASRGPWSWLHMIDDLGASIVAEAWDPQLKPNMTYSHAWGTAPVNVIARHVLGVRVIAPGAARLRISPQPGPLTAMDGTVPTIRGDVRVRLQDGALEVDLPANTTAAVRWAGRETEAGPGRTRIG